MVALKLPRFIDHIATNIFLDKKEVKLYILNDQKKLFFDTSQGYLETDFHMILEILKKIISYLNSQLLITLRQIVQII